MKIITIFALFAIALCIDLFVNFYKCYRGEEFMIDDKRVMCVWLNSDDQIKENKK